MYGWCDKCKAIALEGRCSEHGATKPLSFINSIDIRPLTKFEKQLLNNESNDIKLGEGIFLVYGDRYYRRKIVFLNKPLLEFKLLKDGIHVKPYVKGRFEGMNKEDLFIVNKDRLDRLVQTSKEFADYAFSENGYSCIISFSGGKDSIALAYLLKKYKMKKVFIDTGIEFKETYDFIKRFKDDNGNLDVIKAKSNFFLLCKEKGFPKYETRWCCKTQKFKPFNDYLEEKFNGEPVFVYTGQRRWEGLSRLESPFKKPHKYIVRQISIQPMLEWLTMDVWNYIWANNISVNKIYNIFGRGGCWPCPFGLKYRMFILQYTHPKLYNLIKKYTSMVSNNNNKKESSTRNRMYKSVIDRKANSC